jgi:cell wall-associated NlpC family hydrolase
MADRGQAVAARARRLIGVRFRLQGRSPAEGLDCAGVALLAIGSAGDKIKRDYQLRGTGLSALERELAKAGLVRAGGAPAAGDVLVFAPGPEQLHLAVFTGTGFVHADAGLKRVVERPLPFPWPLLGAWQVDAGEEGASEWRL